MVDDLETVATKTPGLPHSYNPRYQAMFPDENLSARSPRARAVSGMRPSGALHLGHYHGALKNWVLLQRQCDSFFCVADWDALATRHVERDVIERNVYDTVIDWIAAGLDTDRCTVYLQSRLPERAELFTLLAMAIQGGLLNPVEKRRARELATYGFHSYPLLQAAGILLYKAAYVPVLADQSSHLEFTRQVARRFNQLCGGRFDFEAQVFSALAKLDRDDARHLERHRKIYQESGDLAAIAKGEAIIRKAAAGATDLGGDGTDLLLGHLRGTVKALLTEPQALHAEVAKLPGLDGKKMSKRRVNAIAMRDEPAVVTDKVRRMRTDPQRMHRTDPGDPGRCPVWQFHKVYTDSATRQWVSNGCTAGGLGCLECKQPVIDAIIGSKSSGASARSLTSRTQNGCGGSLR